MPDTVSLHLEEVSEEALKERINLRKVTAAVDMYDQLLQAGENTEHTPLYNICSLSLFYKCYWNFTKSLQFNLSRHSSLHGNHS